MPFNTAVLFIVFNRPDTTAVVFEAIKKAKPPRLYVAADGLRAGNENDSENCFITREIATAVDWDCELKTFFRDENVGCGIGPSSAITWFFENEEEGIILEDDCMPDPSFFMYCQELLEKYRHDTRVMHITGSNFQYGWQHDKDYSYYFSSYAHEWGWATWRSAWQLYDFNVKNYEEVIKKDYLNNYFATDLEKSYRLNKIAKSYNNDSANWWDYQWSFALFINSGLAIIPNVNLIKNIGFGGNATHTVSANDKLRNNTARAIELPLRHPKFVIRNRISERRYFRSLFRSIIKRKIYSLFRVNGYSFNG